ncbi:hypothetical protein [Gimesia aquarii]|uniref:hypothetical protein n=1 Tax=Gimesia aquarii TaxID=2527964 RepID=UPI0011A4BF65|nr:hypothetical protein [Gimesia aquarii]
MTEIENTDKRDPWQILLNRTGFRNKFHIYEIAQKWDRKAGRVVYVVRKQLISHASMAVMQEIRELEKHTELQVDHDDVKDIYEMVRDLSLPASRTQYTGKDGTWYGLRIGIRACSTTIRWWSDIEPGLQSVYKLRDKIINTVNQLIRSHKNANIEGVD